VIKHLVFCFFLLGLASQALGAEVLTYEDCVREATQNNPDLAAAEEAVRRAAFQHRASFGSFMPQISADAGYNRSDSSDGTVLSGSDTQEDYSLGLSVRQSLFTGRRNKAETDRTKAELEAAGAALSAVKAQLSFDLKSAFSQILFAQEQLELAEAIADRRKENTRLVELRYDAGREHKGSLLRSQAAHQRAEFEVAQSKRAVRVAQRQLVRILGRREFQEIAVTGDFIVTPPEKPSDFYALAAQTPAHLEPAARVRAAEAGVVAAQGLLYPEIAATGSLSRLGGDWPPDDHQWSTGVVLTLPLFTGGRNYFDLQAARVEHRRTLENLKSADDQIVLELEQAFAAFQDSIESAKVQEEFLKAAEARAEIARSLYTNGLLSFDDWDLIENDRIATQKDRIISLRETVVSEAAWERAQGKGSIP
jgi:outer membrane protein TolC